MQKLSMYSKLKVVLLTFGYEYGIIYDKIKRGDI